MGIFPRRRGGECGAQKTREEREERELQFDPFSSPLPHLCLAAARKRAPKSPFSIGRFVKAPWAKRARLVICTSTCSQVNLNFPLLFPAQLRLGWWLGWYGREIAMHEKPDR